MIINTLHNIAEGSMLALIISLFSPVLLSILYPIFDLTNNLQPQFKFIMLALSLIVSISTAYIANTISAKNRGNTHVQEINRKL